MENDDEKENILKPGEKIKPIVTNENVERLLERLYGIIIKEICELISYDDKNYLVHADRNIKNPIITSNCPHGYVLKIMNSLDSKKDDFVDGQTDMLRFLEKKNIKCPKPVANVNGKYYSIEKIGNTNHIVRLLEFLPGKIFHEVPPTVNLFYQTGEFVAKVDNCLKNFKHKAYETHKSLWMLESLPRLKEFIFSLKDAGKLDIVEQVIEKFNENVLSKLQQFEKGIIHGDFNEQNILVNKTSKPNEYRVTGILDFGDTCYTSIIFELAIAMTYMMMQTGNLETGGIVMAGYNSVRVIPKHERDILKICIAARLCQSLVLGTYTHSLDPGNDYLLTTQGAGWSLLQLIWSQSDETVNAKWDKAADEYLTKSDK